MQLITLCQDVFSSDMDGISYLKDGRKMQFGFSSPKSIQEKVSLFEHVMMWWCYTFMYPGYCEVDEL